MSLKAVLSTVAPTIATALGGPLAGAGVKFITDKFLGNPNATETDIAQAILSASPQDLAKLKELDNQFELEMRNQGIEFAKVEVESRLNAQKREIELAKTGKRDFITPVIAAWILMSSISVVFYVLYLIHSGDVSNVECTIVGGLVTHYLTESKEVRAYYLGGLIEKAKDYLTSKRQ